MNRFDGESQRLATASMYSLSHLTTDEINLNAEEMEGLACGTGPQSIQTRSNSPGGMRAPMSAVEDADGPTT